MKRLLFILAILLTLPAFCAAKNPHVNERIKYKQGPSFIYRLYLTDKKGTPYTLNHPNRFLSRRSIERRKRQQLLLTVPTCLSIHAIYDSSNNVVLISLARADGKTPY